MSATGTERPCSLLIHYEQSEPPNIVELRKTLETGNEEQKIDALKTAILLMLNGENVTSLLMTIIRFIMPLDNKLVKKLYLIYLEVVDKTNAEGKLLNEMILVCNFLRNDLIHPNEYVRGSTLRFLSKIHQAEILEPLVPSVIANLEHKHAFVRRNAVLALFHVYKNFDSLCPNATDLVFNFLQTEGDSSCKRNAFIMLFNCAQDKAIEYLSEVLDQVSSMGEVIQLIVVELIRKVCRTNPTERSKYIKCIFTLLQSSSPAVQYEAAGTLVALSSVPAAIRGAASAFIDLLVKESDNNVKMVVLDRLMSIKQRHSKVLQELLMDILRALNSPNMDIRRKTLDIALDLVSPKNIEEVVLVLKKEIGKTQSKELDKAGEYRQLLIQAIHACAVKFPDIASSVVHLLMDFLGDADGGSAVDVILFVREVVEMYADLRASITRKLLETLDQIKSSKVYRATLWIIGEYSTTAEDIDGVFTTLREALGDLPLVPEDEDDAEAEKKREAQKVAQPAAANVSRVLADGTYATQSAMMEEGAGKGASVPHLRSLLLGGDFFLGSVLVATLAKLALKSQQHDIDQITKNLIVVEVLTIATSILRLGSSSVPPTPIDPDSRERIVQCIRALTEPSEVTRRAFQEDTRHSFSVLLVEQQKSKPVEPTKKKEVDVQADDLIKVRQLRSKKGAAIDDELYEDADADLEKATGVLEGAEDLSNKLNRVVQLTGFSDPLYAEAFVNVHQYDIVLDVIVTNQTGETLQNVALELATLGDLKLVERPQTHTLAPHERKAIKANIKVSSTETGIIFGNIVYDIAGVSASDKNCVILNDIHIDIMDYISPAHCTEVKFRQMWAEFEWENKVAVNTSITDVNDFLKHIVKVTNMACLTPESALAGDCGFLSANLYAKSAFGEDALANLSVERQVDATGRVGAYFSHIAILDRTRVRRGAFCSVFCW
eukprot:TRINITY_DN4132_c0_g1_i2.p1 TRINITY_DN4132_c0_g1~~TRINITY_DN4132_c0_g1_i2.p1  ORF type:complete len:946 (+),score=352.53 TRINITY_DN4132_c0_g1_i2:57-2894(+)